LKYIFFELMCILLTLVHFERRNFEQRVR